MCKHAYADNDGGTWCRKSMRTCDECGKETEMTLSMTEAEILGSYRRSDNKGGQIKVLAELNGTSQEVIAQYLEDHGEKVDQRFWRYKKRPQTDDDMPLQETVTVADNNLPDQTAKADAGKPRLTLVPMQILWDIAEVREFGCVKYEPENWKTVEPERLREALLRHVIRYIDDPDGVDEESGLPHLSHAACNMAFLCAMRKGL